MEEDDHSKTEAKFQNGNANNNRSSNGTTNGVVVMNGHQTSDEIKLDQLKLEKDSEASAAVDMQTEDEENSKGFLCCKKSPVEPEDEIAKVGFFKLFRFADKLDVFMMVFGSICMMLLGAAFPVNIYFFGNVITELVVFDTPSPGVNMSSIANATMKPLSECAMKRLNDISDGDGVLSQDDVMYMLTHTYVLAFIGIGLSAFVVAYFGMTLWVLTGDRQIRRVRTAYFQAVMRQSIGWFDIHNTSELNSRMVEDMDRLNDGFGDKMATFIQWTSTFLGGYSIGFITGWKLTLAMMAASPLLVFTAAFMGRFMRTFVRRELQAYAKAGAVAEETFASIRTVAAFGGEKKAEQKFAHNLQDALKEGVRKATVGGATGGIFWLLIFLIFALAFWYGAKLTRDDCLAPGAILQVFFGVLLGSMSLGQAAPLLENFTNARAAAALLFKTIDMEVEIDSSSDEGLKPDSLEGDVEFTDVNFSYPARKDIQVLRGLNLSVKKGETVALVGESGCGKSTTIQLLQRFYECAGGKVLIDGKDLREYNLTWLRNYMGIVSQEPVLFPTTIKENIKLGAKWADDVTDEQMEVATKEANCYDFITKLPMGFDTLVGERGVQLSGGQKQRIAIARALVRNPAILLLDEATSALDTQSEAIVQDALDKASKGRTTIVIAHRLSTVKAANKIFAFKEGKVDEEGSHDELMAMKGVYYSLVMQQLQREKEEEEEHEKDMLRSLSRSLSNTSSIPHSPGIHLEVPGSPAPSSLSPNLYKRSSSARRSQRSIQSIKELTSDGYMSSSIEDDVIEELALEEGVTVAKHSANADEENEATDISLWEILNMNRPEWYLIVIGAFAATISGIAQPIFAILMSEIIGTLSLPDPVEQQERVTKFVGFIVLAGVVAAMATITQNSLFALSGERMTTRLRKQCFAAIIKQDIAYFDDEKNGVGYLTSRLSSEASQVKGATGMRIGAITQSCATISAALIISFVFVWELTLVLMVFMPVMVLAGTIQHKLIAGYSKADKASIEEGSKMAQQAISNMRTVTSLNKQKYFTNRFFQHFKALYKKDIKKSFVHGIAFAVSQGILFFMYAICFGFGGYLMVCDCTPWRDERIVVFHILRVFAATIFGSMAVGRVTSQLPDFTKAKTAAYNIKQLLGRNSAIDPTSTDGEVPKTCDGTVQFTDVEFQYPTRRTVQVLQGLNFTIKRGETLALVGASGCGKSTSIALLERFYDAAAGKVAIDGVDVQTLNIQWLRQNIGIVSQEPSLFNASIAENIAYGDNAREVSMTEIIEAATQANAHNFISSLPKGYETNVGAKGTQLSGGQKQRIAIARALVRNPAILLLDEATSALDTESEKVVQDALDKALKGRAAIIIAHRLTTIRNANKIGVIENGKIVEMGTHQELLSKKEFYYNLINAQL